MSDEIRLLRLMVRGAYDLQALRIQNGLRLCANFRAKLMQQVGEEPDDELSEEAEKLIDQLKDSYRRLTDGVARNRSLPKEEGFVGDELIHTHTELTLIDQYMKLETQETTQFRQMTSVLTKIPIYNYFLKQEQGVGPAMASVLVTHFDPHKAKYVSCFWSYAGLDVAPDGSGRSRRKEHLNERDYVNKDGIAAKKLSTTYHPWLKTKLLGVLASSFLRSKSRWKIVYDNYKHRLQSDPARIKVEVTQWKKVHKTGESVQQLWTPGRIHKAAQRYMIKMFLADFWAKWRELEGLEVTPTYQEAKLGHFHGEDHYHPNRDDRAAE